MMDTDYCLERRLSMLDSDLHRRYKDCILTSQTMLTHYQRVFPEYTDHSILQLFRSLSADTFLQEVDLIALFSNLLDNAIEGCETIDTDRFIRVADHLDEHTYTIKVTNSKGTTSVSDVAEPLKTRKPNAELHGLGTQIISEIAKRYHGTVRFHDLGSTFETIVLLQL